MVEFLKEISTEEFNKLTTIKFNNILEGLDKYPSITLDFFQLGYDEDKIINLLNDIYEENQGECYIDFYINRLNAKEKENFLDLVDEEDRSFFEEVIKRGTNSVYFKILSKELIPMFSRLNTREVFFVTFYFTKKPITIWGNYNLKFPCFFEDEETMDFYKGKIN